MFSKRPRPSAPHRGLSLLSSKNSLPRAVLSNKRMQPTSAPERELRSGAELPMAGQWNVVIVRAGGLPLAADAQVVRQQRVLRPESSEAQCRSFRLPRTK